MLYEVFICPEDHHLDEPYFTLSVIENDMSDEDKLVTKTYKAKFSLLETQEGYARFYARVVEAITNYDEQLNEWSPTILYYMLLKYSKLVEADFEQHYLMDSPSSLRFSQPLARIFKSYINEETRIKEELIKFKERNIQPRGASPKKLTLDLSGEPYLFEDPAFVEWVLKALRKSIMDGDYPFAFGWNMNELANALIDNSTEQLETLIKMDANEPIIANSQFMSSFCLSTHQLVCGILNKDLEKFQNNQFELYSSFLSLFKIERHQEYQFKGLKGAERKRAADKFRVLLKRQRMRH